MKASIVVLALAAAAVTASAQASYTMDDPRQAESFRIGVEAYGKGSYAAALASFEKALTAEADDPLALYWLGKAYLKLGSSGTAFSMWRKAASAAGGSPFIESRLELAGAMTDPAERARPSRYIRMTELDGRQGKLTLFLRPSWIEPLPNGSTLLVSHGTDEILLVDANGRIDKTYNGGSTGFDRPFAVAVLDDGTMFVSEFQADRVARLSAKGDVLGYSGDPSGPGRLSGPQALCADADGFVYVVDVGFSRVVKYSRDGAMVLSFGQKTPEFQGLRMPTGIVAAFGRVFVADAALGGIYAFDPYGNYMGRLPVEGLRKPEGLRVDGYGGLLIADGSRVLSADIETGATVELFRSERRSPRIVSAAFDANGELLVADFDASELVYASDPQARFSGLSIEIRRASADAFPKVSLDVSVKDRYGRPVSGLDQSNFYIAEQIVSRERRIEGAKQVDLVKRGVVPAAAYSFDGSLDLSTRVDACFVVEGSAEMVASRGAALEAVKAAHAALSSGDFSASLVVAGRNAQPPVGPGVASFDRALRAMSASLDWRFADGIRLAAGVLFGTSGRRAICFIGSGTINDEFIGGASLAELATMLSVNDIRFDAIIVGREAPSEAIRYLTKASGGVVVRADRPEGLAPLIADLRSANTGMYRLSYQSAADDGFGKAYLPVSVEAYLRDRSGRDETGFFAPLR